MTRLLALLVLVALASSCASNGRPDHRPIVVVGFYPIAEAVQRVAGDKTRLIDLTPPGAEPHDLEITTSQASDLLDADLVLLMGRGFQPAVERLARTRTRGDTVEVLRRIAVVGGDPHVWLDPVLMKTLVSEVTIAVDKVDRADVATFERNGARYTRALQRLDERFARGLHSCRRKLIVTSHEAFGYLARRYGLEQRSIAGISPEAEPNPARLNSLAQLVRREGVTTIFTEKLVSARVAQTLAREAHVKTAVLDPIEGAKAGDGYVKIMDRNLSILRTALGCS